MARKLRYYPNILAFSRSDSTFILTFSNGEIRTLDFRPIIEESKDRWFGPGLKAHLGEAILEDGTLAWPMVKRSFKQRDGTMGEAHLQYSNFELYERSALLANPSEEQLREVGKKIRAIRKELGMTQEELAKKSGTGRANISKLESGKLSVEFATLLRIIEQGLGRKPKLQF